MKKSLLALAALSAFATAAQAQSNVTIYGAYGNGLNMVETNGGKAVNSMGGAALGTPVLGFRGTEDLGGGNKAFFALESTLGANGSLGYTSVDAATAGGNNIFDRQAHAGVSTQFGTLSFGRQNDPVKDTEGLSALTNLIDGQNSTQVGDRYANLTKYTSPSIQGLVVSYAYSDSAVGSSGTDAGSTTTTIPNSAALDGTKLRSFAAQYAFKGIKFAYANGMTATTAGVENTTVRYSAQGEVMGATVGVSYTENELNTAGTDTRDQTTVSVKVPFSQGYAAYASYTDNDSTTATTNGKGYTLMLTKDFSKRTTVYVGYADLDVDTATSDTKTTTIGLFHRF